MADPVGSVTEVVKLALVIKSAVDTVRHNKAACVKLTNTLELMRAIVAPLENMSEKPEVRATLTSLEGALRRGHNLVIHCQRERNFFYTLFRSRNLSNELLQVKDDIKDHILYAIFALAVNTNTTLTFVRDRPPPIEGAGVMDSSRIGGESYSTNSMGIHIVQGNNDASPLIIFHPIEMEAATNNFSEENEIGKCASATFYQGLLSDELIVAIKKYTAQLGPQSIRQYIHVYQLLVEHENLVRFLGFCHAEESEMVVEEYMPNQSLFEIINGSSKKLDWLSTFRVIQGIAEGVAYLHSKNVIHSDLNPANIVFDTDMNPKISNFDRSKILNENVSEAVSYELVGTMGYMSPEYIMDGIIAKPSDVFGFGVLLLHSISGMRSSVLEQHPITWAWEVRKAQGMNGLLDSSWGSDHQLEEIKRSMDIGLLCTQEFPENRPTMPDVVEFLKGNQMLPTPKKPCFI